MKLNLNDNIYLFIILLSFWIMLFIIIFVYCILGKQKYNNHKYTISSEEIVISGITLHRIIAVKNFGGIKAGDLGGYVESYKNLSQYDNSWIYSGCIVFGDAKIKDNSKVYNNSICFGSTKITGDSSINNCIIAESIIQDRFIIDTTVISNYIFKRK